ncbi:MAG: CBS domain-containing protein [Chloroflexi bacterium]|nr:CBS domain-containing protein [Chloroflexota bacterium]MBU1749327.1 CBS domain-containing protein [Chloroflexota bacterium]
MKLVRQLLQAKGLDVWSIAPDASVYEALELMADKNVGAVLVLDAGRVVGILSERDYARKVMLRGISSKDTPVREIMTKEVLFVRLDDSIEACMVVMTDKRVRHLPVIEDDQLIGIISIGDVVKGIISDQQFTINELEKYITGGAYRPENPIAR